MLRRESGGFFTIGRDIHLPAPVRGPVLRTEPGVAANLHGCRAYLTSGNVTAGALR